MNRTNLVRAGLMGALLVATGLSGVAAAATPATQPAAGGFKGTILPPPTRVSEHVYAWIGPHGGPNKANKGYRMNLAFAVGKSAVAVFETGYTEPMAEEMLKHIAAITPLPVKYAINSNSQPDRFLGNDVFRRAGATVIAHENEAKRMAEQGSNFVQAAEQALELPAGTIKIPAQPTKIIKGDMDVDLGGGVVLKIKYFGPAHTPGPLVVHIPKDNIVYGGDILYSGRLPAVIPDSNVKSWIAVFNKLKSFGNVTFVPGHGVPAKLSAFQFSTHDYLVHINNHMAKMVKDGVDMQESINRLDQSAFAKLENFEELSGRNASWTYIERETEAFK